ncbi:MAG: tetrahydrofolate dehydrogenase/cyclohydrolase catalytic domain-containing protein [Patescibacteria group bacterium]|nr:bifunctional 5,10-methylene-tetrahydrofolate dehydrogenase/5,10-methylene-tetrahydrofolate cyclohydrolase [Patescibacteria group bacterium]
MSEIIKGRQLADAIREKAKARIEKLDQPPGLAAILVGADPASQLYVSLKEKAAKEVGIYFEKFEFEADAKTKTIIEKIRELNKRADINGILVQLPLPNQDEDKIIAAIDHNKDVDGFHMANRGKLITGEESLVPPVSLAIMRLIQASNQPLKGKHMVVVANNAIFAEPLTILAKRESMNSVFVKSDDPGISAKTRGVDVIVVAVGKIGFITKDMVKDGAIVIDVGTNKKGDQTVGDVAEDVHGHAAFISPVPGGVGPLTVAYLLTNVIHAKELQEKL